VESNMIRLVINAEERTLDVDPDTPLLWVLRDTLDLTGTKYGCGIAQCGACTVHLDGNATRSCILPVSQVGTRSITTIEGLNSKSAYAVQAAWEKLDVVQCGYCQSGQIMSATALLSQNPDPSEQDINKSMAGNICRCATYHRIRAAIKEAAKTLS
jgi:isoquinoline 1-oxidoreductase alpha subunit